MHASYLHQRFKAGTVVNRVCHLKGPVEGGVGGVNEAVLQSMPWNCIKGGREESCDCSAILGLVL